MLITILFILLACAVVYGALIVPVYNFVTRPVKARRDLFIVIFAVAFTLAILQILWSVHGDLRRWLG